MNQLLLNFSTNSQKKLEKLVLLNIVGVISALEENVITLEEAEKIIFSPYVMDLLHSKRISNDVIEVVHLGTELEDIESLIPGKLIESLNHIKIRAIELLKERNIYKIEENMIT
ncbi:DUF3969 family protein [Lysinibacillus louembei]|uniref:DUF3969 family protein n=1 Tax=Lysinibacillus louembei TaxID=1470088 RepID=A0ABZ0S0U0_9BACI|nr:DUF3969 family protein [Lysinibacillus louembei]WPK12740.1 DUF3969 family protein [Lysinibacillus louembei]